ncbi:MAG: class I SAM-dependent rRNA methyltransferase [Deltaproteobacteria bacterium]|nr:class I SAM-dependent rRNA methyltransferase [Deltaproteobacteria bacterium]
MRSPVASPVARVTQKGAQRLRRGNPWCYRTELMDPPHVRGPGQVVDVVDAQGNPVGQALYARASPLALRLLTREPSSACRVDDAFFESRLEAALSRRAVLSGRDAFRLVHGESDLLPGLLVDRFGQGLSVQTLSEGMDARKAQLAAALKRLTGAQVVVCRDDHSGRDFEQLPREKRLLAGEGSTRVRYHEGENAYEVDLLEDMKTGGFLDQVDNHLRAGELARGEALDTFSYHGGFALALARTCRNVLAVEQDAQAAARAAENARRNGRASVSVQQGNAFDVLRAFEKEGRRFDTVVLDPPAFAKRKEGLKTALRAYRELNLRAFKLLRAGGLLVTCSCSGKVTRQAFEEMVAEAAGDARRPVALLERRGAGMDHPPLVGLPETEYLKTDYYRVLA